MAERNLVGGFRLLRSCAVPSTLRSPDKRPRQRLLLGVLVVMVAAQVALPLAQNAAAALVSVVVVAMAAASVLIASSTWPYGRLWKVSAVVPLGLLIELLGSRTGFPFGGYHYGDGLQPQILDVPVVVPFAWLAIALAAWEIARRITASKPLQFVAGGLAITAWDLFLDPLMVSYRYWVWDNPSGWQDIPLSNFVGWIAVGTLFCAVASWALGPAEPNNGLAALYVWMTAFSALGFLLPFAFDRPLAGLVVVVAAAPLVLAALTPRRREWLEQS